MFNKVYGHADEPLFKDFFDEDSANPSKAKGLFEIAKTLSNDQLDSLINLAKGLRK